MYAGDSIAAVATPPGHGGVAIVRVSGPLCTQIAAAVFSRSSGPGPLESHRLYHGRVLDEDGRVLDEGLAALMRAPRSYTGEDVLELQCHGSPVIVRRVLARVLSCGARLAEPGEFTRRAFLNGRLDLTQAEAVIDMVRARSAAAAALAAEQLGGRLSKCLEAIRTQLIRLKALLEAQIDFSEEDIAIPRADLLLIDDHCTGSIDELLDTYKHGKIRRDGLRVTIVGKPNVGKSSLLNALLGEERALVTDVAGTTRDFIEETADFDGVPVVLSDTAGLRAAEKADTVERLGMGRTTAKIAESEVVLAILDASAPLDAEDLAVLKAAESAARLIVFNKIDLPKCVSDAEVARLNNRHPIVAVSAKERLGLEELRRGVVELAASGVSVRDDGPVLTNLRHVDALTKARGSLTLARQSICDARPPELIAVDVQDAIDHLGEITGAITSDEIMDRVFSEFCIGK